jgi:hypothetical protein
MNLEDIKAKLRSYKREEIRFKEHLKYRVQLREGSKEEVISHILNPEKLVYFECKEGQYRDMIYSCYFAISNTRTLMVPLIFNEKTLYILTYILKYRCWEGIVKSKEAKKWKK